MKVEKGDQYKDRLKRKKELERKLNNLDGTVESNEEQEVTQEEPLETKKSAKFFQIKPFKSSIEEIDFKENRNLEIIELQDFNEEDEQNDYSNNENASLNLDNQSLFSIELTKDDKYDTDADQEDFIDYESDYVSEYGEDVKGDVAF